MEGAIEIYKPYTTQKNIVLPFCQYKQPIHLLYHKFNKVIAISSFTIPLLGLYYLTCGRVYYMFGGLIGASTHSFLVNTPLGLPMRYRPLSFDGTPDTQATKT